MLYQRMKILMLSSNIRIPLSRCDAHPLLRPKVLRLPPSDTTNTQILRIVRDSNRTIHDYFLEGHGSKVKRKLFLVQADQETRRGMSVSLDAIACGPLVHPCAFFGS